MKKDIALAKLRPLEQRLRAQGVSALYLFGSVARDEADERSDIDVLFETVPDSGFTLFRQAGLQADLSDALGAKVDFVSRGGLRPRVRQRIEPELVRVF